MLHVSIRPQLLDFAAAVELNQRKRVELAVQTADRELRVPPIITGQGKRSSTFSLT